MCSFTLLILAETLLDPNSAGDCNLADTNTEYSSSSGDEECPKPMQVTGFAQRVAVEVHISCQILFGCIIDQGHLETLLASQCCRPNGALIRLVSAWPADFQILLTLCAFY